MVAVRLFPILLIASLILTAIGCDELSISSGDDQSRDPANRDTQSKSGWRSDTISAVSLDGRTQKIPGVSLRAENSNAKLFVQCTFSAITLDLPEAHLIGAGESVQIQEWLSGEPYKLGSWEGSYSSSKRLVRYDSWGISSSQDNDDFVRAMAGSQSLRLAYDDGIANFDPSGFRDALSKHCS